MHIMLQFNAHIVYNRVGSIIQKPVSAIEQKWTNEWLDGWIKMNIRTKECIHEWINERINEWVS